MAPNYLHNSNRFADRFANGYLRFFFFSYKDFTLVADSRIYALFITFYRGKSLISLLLAFSKRQAKVARDFHALLSSCFFNLFSFFLFFSSSSSSSSKRNNFSPQFRFVTTRCSFQKIGGYYLRFTHAHADVKRSTDRLTRKVSQWLAVSLPERENVSTDRTHYFTSRG